MRLSYIFTLGLSVFLFLSLIEARPTKNTKRTRTNNVNQQDPGVAGGSAPNMTGTGDGGTAGSTRRGGGMRLSPMLINDQRPERKMTMHQKRMKSRQYMSQYGYMKHMDSGSGQEELTMIQKMQMLMGLRATGKLTDKTLEMMDRPRCGVADPVEMFNTSSPQQYVIDGSKWSKTDLTYRFLNYPPEEEISYFQTRDAIERAFQVWSDVTPLQFTEVDGYADMYILFGSYDHGDPYPFDGPGGTLAHAFLPTGGYYDLDGDVHFDGSEIFDFAGKYGTYNLFQVAAHEIGHGLGLSHSLNPNALMAPFYPGYIQDFTLPYDDVLGIGALYGGRPYDPNPPKNEPSTTQRTVKTTTTSSTIVSPTTTTSKTQTKETTDKVTDAAHTTKQPIPGCDVEFDAIVYYRGDTFFFKGDRYWRMRDYQLVSADQRASDFFQDFPGKIDAAYESLEQNRLYVFKGDSYYVYHNTDLESGPHLISEIDPRLPSDIDAILTWQSYSKTYIFKGNQVWRLDETTRTVDQYWPADISIVWDGVPHDLTAAFHDEIEDYTYFFKGSNYYRYDDRTYAVDAGYPRASFQVDYLQCRSQ